MLRCLKPCNNDGTQLTCHTWIEIFQLSSAKFSEDASHWHHVHFTLCTDTCQLPGKSRWSQTPTRPSSQIFSRLSARSPSSSSSGGGGGRRSDAIGRNLWVAFVSRRHRSQLAVVLNGLHAVPSVSTNLSPYDHRTTNSLVSACGSKQPVFERRIYSIGGVTWRLRPSHITVSTYLDADLESWPSGRPTWTQPGRLSPTFAMGLGCVSKGAYDVTRNEYAQCQRRLQWVTWFVRCLICQRSQD